MVLFNYSTKELTAKIVYYGPGLCGKTTNLQWIHEKTPIKNKGKMLSLATEADRTLFFDFLPIELGQIRGMKTRIQLYTVPGQVFYNATRRMVLKGADCVVFVADSQEPMIDANLDSLANLKENLEANEINPDEIPMVVQFNKRDLPNALPVEILNDRLNPRSLPFFEAVAMKGQGVEETLKGATSLVFRHLASKYGDGSAAGASTSRPTPPAPARPPAPAPAPAPAGPGTVAAPPRPPTVSVPRAVAAAAASAPRPPAPPPPPRPAPPPPPPVVPDETHEEELSFDMSSEPGDVETISVDELALDEPAPPRPAAIPPPAPGGRGVPPAAKTTLVKGADETEDMRRRISRPLEPELTLDTLDEEDIEEISLEAPPAPARSDGPRRPATSTLPPVAPAAPARPAAPLPRPAAPAGAAARASTTTAPPGSRAVAPSAPAPAGPAARGPATNPGAPRFTGAAAATTTTTPPVNVTLRGGTPAEIAIPVEVKVQNGNANVEVHIRLTLNLKLIP